MIREEELAEAIARKEQAYGKKLSMMTRMESSINTMGQQLAQLRTMAQNDEKKDMDLLKENQDLRIRNAALNKELAEQTSRAKRLEEELKMQVQKYQEAIQHRMVVNNVYKRYMAAEYDEDEDYHDTKREQQKEEERSIPMSTVLSFSTTRSKVEQIQTLVDLLYFALDNRTPEEDKAIKQMLTDFLGPRRPQMNVKDSTQNFYM